MNMPITDAQILEMYARNISFAIVAQDLRRIHGNRIVEVQRHIPNGNVVDCPPWGCGPHRVLHDSNVDKLALGDLLDVDVLKNDIFDQVFITSIDG